jgi:hypothetical protein
MAASDPACGPSANASSSARAIMSGYNFWVSVPKWLMINGEGREPKHAAEAAKRASSSSTVMQPE